MPPALETFAPQYFLTKSLDEIAHWLCGQRVPTGDGLVPAEDYSQLRRRFGRLSHRWHPVLTNARLKEPALSVVHDLAVQALGTSKLIYAELENERQGQSILAPAPVLERLLDVNSLLLSRVSAQLELVESTITHADDLHDAAKKLVVGQTVSPVWLVGLARRILLEMRPGPELFGWIPLPGTRLSDCLASRLWKSEPEVYATGIQTARLVAWLGGQLPQFAEPLEILIVAALLEDIGFLRLERSQQKTPSELETRHQDTYRRHPSMGSALAGGLSEYSIELSLLIGQHHERLDGTGYPQGLNRYQQTKEGQFLATLVRFQELLSRMNEERTVESACFQASFQLFLESAQGAWSTKAVALLLEALDIELPRIFDRALSTGQPFVAESFLESRWACHRAQPEVPAPHFLFSRSKSFSRSAGRTLASNRDKVIRHDPKG